MLSKRKHFELHSRSMPALQRYIESLIHFESSLPGDGGGWMDVRETEPQGNLRKLRNTKTALYTNSSNLVKSTDKKRSRDRRRTIDRVRDDRELNPIHEKKSMK